MDLCLFCSLQNRQDPGQWLAHSKSSTNICQMDTRTSNIFSIGSQLHNPICSQYFTSITINYLPVPHMAGCAHMPVAVLTGLALPSILFSTFQVSTSFFLLEPWPIYLSLPTLSTSKRLSLLGVFPGSPMVKAVPSNARGAGSNPGQGAKIPTCLVVKRPKHTAEIIL